MSLDADDPRCPECEGPVSATATYCMHCGAEFEDDTGGTDQQTGTESGATGTRWERLRSRVDGSSTAETDPDAHVLHPDSLADNTLTVLVGIVGGGAIGLLTLVLFLFTTQSGWALLPGLLAWVGGTGYLITRRTVGETFRYSCYGVAFVLAALPIISFSGATKGGTFGGRVILFVVGELLFGLFALAIAGIGYLLTR